MLKVCVFCVILHIFLLNYDLGNDFASEKGTKNLCEQTGFYLQICMSLIPVPTN